MTMGEKNLDDLIAKYRRKDINKQERGQLVCLLKKHVYSKNRFRWSERPSDWPHSVYFGDPNNNKNNESRKKPDVEKLNQMIDFLLPKYEEKLRNNFPDTEDQDKVWVSQFNNQMKIGDTNPRKNYTESRTYNKFNQVKNNDFNGAYNLWSVEGRVEKKINQINNSDNLIFGTGIKGLLENVRKKIRSKNSTEQEQKFRELDRFLDQLWKVKEEGCDMTKIGLPPQFNYWLEYLE